MKILFTFLTEKKTCFRPIRSLFTEFFYQQIIVISSQNNVRKYRTKGHEQVLCIRQVVLETPMTKWQEKLSKLLWQIVTLATGLFCTKSARMSTCTFSVPSWRNYNMTWNQNLETSKRRPHCQIINLLRRLKKIRRVLLLPINVVCNRFF